MTKKAVENMLRAGFKGIIWFTEDMVYLWFSDKKLERFAVKTEENIEEENPIWVNAYYKARLDVLNDRLDDEEDEEG